MTGAEIQMISAGASLLSGLFGSRRRNRQQREAKAQYEEMRAAYEGLDTSNIYADVKNPYEGMENTMEDLRVNTQQADFMAQQGAQARADILGGFRQAAGGSGIAALAQSLANQQTQQAAQMSASIGQQEAANQRASAIQAGRIQQLERAGELQAQTMRLGGEAQSRALEYQKTGTMFGMGQQRLAGANRAVAQGQSQIAAGIGGLAAGFASGTFGDFFGGQQLTGAGGANMKMATPIGTSASGQPLVTQVMTPTGGEINTGGAQYNYGGGLGGANIVGYDAYGNPIYA